MATAEHPFPHGHVEGDEPTGPAPGCCGKNCGEVPMIRKEGEFPHPPDGCEEKCMPGFWHDSNNIHNPKPPPLPILNWVFDPRNKWLNDNRVMRIFGNIGIPYCDMHRKEMMGLAMGLTVISMLVTVMGCFGALSTDPSIVFWTNWLVVMSANQTACTGDIMTSASRRRAWE